MRIFLLLLFIFWTGNANAQDFVEKLRSAVWTQDKSSNDRYDSVYPQYQKLKEALNNGNLTSAERQEIINTMGRWRAMPRITSNRFIVVNIPHFELFAYKNGELELKSRIVVGDEYSKTPIFAAEINEVTFNPVWHVPGSIAKDELFPEGDDYLERNGFVRTGNGLIQEPGPGNALGRLRFTVNEMGKNSNKYGVFIHDTPYKEDFQDADLAIGHGCIRVQNVVELARFVFNDDNWSEDRIRDAMEGSTTTQTVRLNSRVPVIFGYFTAWVRDDGTVDFAEDVYGYEKNVRS